PLPGSSIKRPQMGSTKVTRSPKIAALGFAVGRMPMTTPPSHTPRWGSPPSSPTRSSSDAALATSTGRGAGGRGGGPASGGAAPASTAASPLSINGGAPGGNVASTAGGAPKPGGGTRSPVLGICPLDIGPGAATGPLGGVITSTLPVMD